MPTETSATNDKAKVVKMEDTEGIFDSFGEVPEDGIYLPPFGAFPLRTNCQSGRWTSEEEEYSPNLSFIVLQFLMYYGNLGQTQNEEWGQIFLVPLNPPEGIPPQTVCSVYIKTKSLRAFKALVTQIKAAKLKPGEGIFSSEFIKHSDTKIDEHGKAQPVNYYSVRWHWRSLEDEQEIDLWNKCFIFKQSTPLLSDVSGTREMICLDHLPPEQRKRIAETNLANPAAQMLESIDGQQAPIPQVQMKSASAE